MDLSRILSLLDLLAVDARLAGAAEANREPLSGGQEAILDRIVSVWGRPAEDDGPTEGAVAAARFEAELQAFRAEVARESAEDERAKLRRVPATVYVRVRDGKTGSRVGGPSPSTGLAAGDLVLQVLAGDVPPPGVRVPHRPEMRAELGLCWVRGGRARISTVKVVNRGAPRSRWFADWPDLTGGWEQVQEMSPKLDGCLAAQMIALGWYALEVERTHGRVTWHVLADQLAALVAMVKDAQNPAREAWPMDAWELEQLVGRCTLVEAVVDGGDPERAQIVMNCPMSITVEQWEDAWFHDRARLVGIADHHLGLLYKVIAEPAGGAS